MSPAEGVTNASFIHINNLREGDDMVVHEVYGSDNIAGDVEYGMLEEGDAFL